MYPHSFLWHYLWIAPHALQIIVAVVMVRRGLFREFPVFFAYTVFQVLEEGTLFILDHSAAISGYQYWCAHSVGLAIDVALRFAIIVEIFSSVFRNYPGLKHLCRIFFRGALWFCCLLQSWSRLARPRSARSPSSPESMFWIFP